MCVCTTEVAAKEKRQLSGAKCLIKCLCEMDNFNTVSALFSATTTLGTEVTLST